MFREFGRETETESIGAAADPRIICQNESQIPGSRNPAGESAGYHTGPFTLSAARPCARVSRGREKRQEAVAALAALGTDRGIAVFRHLSAESPMAVPPVMIARELGLTVRAVSSELTRLSRVGLVGYIGTGRKKAFFADIFRARKFLEQVHELARVLAPC